MFNLLGGCLCTGDARRRGNDSRMGIQAFQVKGICALRAILQRVRTSSRCAGNDVLEVGEPSGSQSTLEALKGSSIRHTKTVMQQSLGINTAEISKSGQITVIRLDADIDALIVGYSPAI